MTNDNGRWRPESENEHSNDNESQGSNEDKGFVDRWEASQGDQGDQSDSDRPVLRNPYQGDQPSQDGQQGLYVQQDQRPFGYFQDSGPSYPSYSSNPGSSNNYSEYGQFGDASGDYVGPRSPYTGSNGSPFPLHPLTPMEQIDAAIRLIRFNPAVLIVLPLLVYLIVGLISIGISYAAGEAAVITVEQLTGDFNDLPTGFIVSMLLASLVSFFASLLIYTTSINASMSAVYGRKISIGRAISMSVGDAGRLGLAYLVYALAFLALTALLGFGILPLFAGLGDGFFAVVMIALIIGGIYLAIRFVCVVPVLVAEQRGPINSISRSLQLTRGRAGSIFVTFLVTLVLMIVMSIVISIVMSLVAALSGSIGGAIAISSITSAIATAFMAAIVQAVSNVIYINLRMEREDFHHQVRNS